jgi:diguanylate cyclase
VILAGAIRRNVVKGLHWYDFVAVLEQILQVLRSAADHQRIEFQGFLSAVNEGLAQVQGFMENSKRYSQQALETDAAMDASVREQIVGISAAVENSDDDLKSLKESVQGQIGAIIRSLDGFKLQRSRQDDSIAEETHLLIARISSLESESRELRVTLARQQETALKDALTELPNREAYDQRAHLLLETWRTGARGGQEAGDKTLCLAVADVDKFKNINDSYGHLAGDKVLKIIARELVSRLRDSDFIARYGGEEFVIIMPDTRPADAEHTLNKLRLGVAAIPFHFKEQQIQITVSFGVVVAHQDDNIETLFERADQALYLAKANGRNRVQRAR